MRSGRPAAKVISILAIWLVGVTISSCGAARQATPRSPGEEAFRANCQSCHSLPKSTAMRADEWPPFLWDHNRRVSLDSTTLESILRHLQSGDESRP